MSLNTQALPLTDSYRQVFDTMAGHVIQQRVAKIANICTVDTFTGKEKIYGDIEEMTVEETIGRLGKTTPKEYGRQKIKAVKKKFDTAYISDKNDKDFAAMMIEPNSEIIKGVGMGWKRRLDQEMFIQLAAAVLTGTEETDVTTSRAYNANMRVAVNYVYNGTPANAGLTPQKLLRASKILMDNFWDPKETQAYLAYAPRQVEDMAQYLLSAPNSPYAKMIENWLSDPDQNKLFGFNTVLCPLLPVESGDIARCVVWTKDAVVADPGSQVEFKIDQRADLKHAWQVSMYGQASFLRRYDERVVEIRCDQSP